VHEFWSAEKSIDATPESMYITGIVGLPPRVAIPPISFPRNFQDSNSIRLGGEYSFAIQDYPIDLRAGAAYESSAVPPAYESLFTIDMDKYTLSLGGSLHVGKRWRFDALYAHLFASTVNVNPATAGIGRVNPIQGNAPFEAVNGGQYSVVADLLGVGVVYKY
jgi:long-chain fatty acid transport protein